MKGHPLLLSVLLLWTMSGCSSPETPQDVARAFWAAVQDANAERAAELSTLVDENGFDGYSADWRGAQISWGRVTVEGDRASIVTRFSDPSRPDREELETTTHLVRINDSWQVDYHHTGDEISADRRLGALMGNLRGLSQALRARVADESEKAARKMDRLADELAAYSEQTQRELSSRIEHYGESLERRMEALSRALDEALESNPDATDKDRQILEEARKELQRQQHQHSRLERQHSI